MATIAHFGPDKYLDYWKSLRDNGVQVVDGWETAYYTNFSASSGKGPQPMVVSSASSPAAEVIYATTKVTDAPTASLIGPGTSFPPGRIYWHCKGHQASGSWQKSLWISSWEDVSRKICRCKCSFTRF